METIGRFYISEISLESLIVRLESFRNQYPDLELFFTTEYDLDKEICFYVIYSK